MTLVFERSVVKESQQNWRCVLLDHCYQKQLIGRQVCFCVFWSACKILVFAVAFCRSYLSMCPLSNRVSTIFPTFAIVEDTIGFSRGL